MVWHPQFTSESPDHEKAKQVGYLGLANPAGHRHQDGLRDTCRSQGLRFDLAIGVPSNECGFWHCSL